MKAGKEKNISDLDYVYVDLVNNLYRQSFNALLATFLSSLIILYFLRGVLSNHILYTWFVVLTIFTVIRLYISYIVLKREWGSEVKRARLYEYLFIFIAFISGAIWGSIGMFPLKDTDQVHYFSLMAFIIGGFSAGASTSMAASRKAFIAFLIPILIPITIKMSSFEDQVSHIMVLFMTLYFFSLIFINRANHSNLYSGIKSKFQNADLLKQMQQTNRKLKKLNSEGKKLHTEMAKEIEARKKVEKNLEELSSIDSLTGLYNRRFFEAFALNYLHQCARFDEIFSIILIDIDNFKSINDTYGHQEGDAVLIEISQIFRESVRKSDVVARYGGEEFIILCPHHGLEGAQIVAEKMRLIIEKSNISKKTQVTVSIGVSTLKKSMSLDDLIRECDEALYSAKNSGKNKVVVSS